MDYSPNPGTGMILFTKKAKNVGLWSGPLTLPNGQKTQVYARADQETQQYVCEIKNSDEEFGRLHEKITEFKMPAFGNKKNHQEVKVPNIGPVMAYKGVTKTTKRACIRLTVLNQRSDVRAAEKVM